MEEGEAIGLCGATLCVDAMGKQDGTGITWALWALWDAQMRYGGCFGAQMIGWRVAWRKGTGALGVRPVRVRRGEDG